MSAEEQRKESGRCLAAADRMSTSARILHIYTHANLPDHAHLLSHGFITP